MGYIELKQITSHYGKTQVLQAVDLEIKRGELHTLLGPSGCGKTTMLRLIGGFLRPTSGRIWLDGRDITELPPERRKMGIVFQNYALFPNLNVEDNVAYGLRLQRLPKEQVYKTVREHLDLVGLGAYRTRKIQELSGGQQQRVAIARALATSPKVLLLDEPMSNLDISLRLKMREELRQIQRQVGITTLFITHDQQEALAISDTVSVMSEGEIQQSGSPRQVYEKPATDFVAAFVGKTNRLGRSAMARWGIPGDQDHVFVRPEQLRIHREPTESANVAGQVTALCYQGALVEYQVEAEGQVYTVLLLNHQDRVMPAVGDRVYLELCR